MAFLTPDDYQKVRIHSLLWAQLFELAGAAQSTEVLQECLALHDCIMAFASDEQLQVYEKALDRGIEMGERSRADDFNRGRCYTMRLICAEQGCEVPAWVGDLEAEIAARREARSAELRARQVVSDDEASGGLVH